MPSLLHASEIVAAIADAPPPRTPPPGASALERLRGKLSQPLDPRDPLSSLAPLIHRLRSPSPCKRARRGAEILRGGGFPMVVLDLGTPPVRGGRGHEASWLRLARAAQAQGAALLVASPYRVSGTAAAVVLQAARGRARWQGAAGGPRLPLAGPPRPGAPPERRRPAPSPGTPGLGVAARAPRSPGPATPRPPV